MMAEKKKIANPQKGELQCPHCHHVVDKLKRVVKKIENGAETVVETAVEIVLAPGMPR
jgi:hypothetical protein